MRTYKHRLTDLTLVTIAAVWGITFVLIQNAVTLLPPFSFLTVRFLASALLLGILLIFPFKMVPKLSKQEWRAHLLTGSLLGGFLFLGFSFQTFSLLYTTSGKSGFLTGLYVALVPVFARIILNNRISPAAVLGVIAAVVGMYLLAFVDLSVINIGDLLALACSIFFALQIIYTGKYAGTSSSFHLVMIQSVIVAILSGISALLFESWQKMLDPAILFSPAIMIAILVTSLFATVFALIFQTYAQKFTSSTRIALIFALEPVFAALGDYWWHGVTLNGRALLGCALILSGMILSELPLASMNLFKKKSPHQ